MAGVRESMHGEAYAEHDKLAALLKGVVENDNDEESEPYGIIPR